MKKITNYLLIAATVCGLSLAATSCKDDDKSDNGGENMEQLESTGGEVSMEDIQLSTLISNFAEVQADELLAQSGWQSKTYEATLGLVLDKSRPTVRTIEVGTIEAADERAEAMLRELGIDGQSPSGFQFSSASVGTVSYQHGGGTDANTLAVINLDVRQLPGISQLRMVKELPANEGTFGYYGRGDIVKKDGRLWICTTPATKKGDYAYFVSFWTRHRTDNCRWGTYKDVVYLAKDEMASGHDLINWLHCFVMWDEGYNYIINCLHEKGITSEDEIEQLLPPTNDIRRELIKRLHFGLDSLPVSPLTMPEWIERNKWGDTPKANGRYCAPRSLLLADKFRYAIDPCEYWVPFVGWATRQEAIDISTELASMKTQNAKTNSNHFQWGVTTVEDIRDNQTKQQFGGADKCQYVVAAVYWKHSYYNSNQWAMFDFTKDWNDKQDINDDNVTDISLWLSCNIVSGTLKFKDGGQPNASVNHVWVARDDDLENIEDGDYGDELKNKPDDETGVYQPGDMVEDETGTKWLCVWGAAHSTELGLSDKTAWFISFDNISNLNNMPQGVIEENDVVQLAVRFASAIYYTTSSKHNDILFKDAGQLGLWQSAYDNAGIDMSKMWVMRDSTWTFNSRGETRNSKTTSLFTNLAYRASDGTLRLLRTIADGTQGGTERNNCYDIDGKKHDMWQYLMYKRYEYYDPQQMRDLTNAEKGLGMTTWNIPWKMWDDKMNFSDLSIQDKVDKFAANDKWVTLPLAGKTNRQQPRTKANSDLIRWQNYMWSKNDKNFYRSDAKSMFNEPVLIMRLMKVNDQGGKRPYLKSQDGRKLKVVKMLDNEQMYVGMFNRIQNQLLKQYTSGGDLQSVYLDNEQYIMELN